jgi:hypothetical protein
MTHYVLPRPTVKMVKQISEELGWPLDTSEAIAALTVWDETEPKPHNLTIWLNDLLFNDPNE